MKQTDSFTHPNSDRVLTVSVVEAYGRETIRPECELSRKFVALLGQKTLTRENVEKIKSLGFVFVEKPREGKL